MMSVLLALAALVLLGLAHGAPLHGALRVAPSFVCLWLAPGAALLKLRGGAKRDFATSLAWCYGFSATLLAAAAGICHFAGLDPARLADLVAVFLGLAAAAPAGRAATPAQPGGAGWSAVQIAGLVAIGVMLARCGGTIGQGFDSLDHLAYMKSILRDHQALPLREFYREATSGAVDLRKGLLHAPLAVTASLSGMDLPRFWRIWPAFLAPCVTACFYVLALGLLGVPGRAMLATLFFVLFFGGPGTAFFLKVGYPNKTADALVWLAWAAAMVELRGDSPAASPPPWLFLAGASLVHVFAAAPWFFAWGVVALVSPLIPGLRASSRPAWRIFGLALAACAPILAWRFVISYAPVNPLHTRVEGFLNLPFGFIAEPMAWLGAAGQATWISLLVSPFFVAADPRPERWIAAIALWAAALILFNPILVPLLAPRLGYLLMRLYPAAVGLVVLAGWVGDRVRSLRGGVGASRAWTAAALAVVTLLLLGDARAAVASYGPGAMQEEQDRSSSRWQAALNFLSQHRPPGVVASDPVSDYAIAGLTPQDALATLNQHSSPSDSEALPRMQAALDILSPSSGSARTAAALRRYGVGLVFVNQTYDRPRLDYMAFLDPSEYPAQLAKFEAQPAVFTQIYRAPGQYIFAVNTSALDAYGREGEPAWPDTAPRAGVAPVPLGEAGEMGEWRLDPREVRAGEDVRLRLLLRTTKSCRPGDRWMAQVTMATPVPRPLAWLPERWRRIAAQRRDHRLYRLNYYLPVGGPRGGPEYWPEGRWAPAELVLHVPTGAAPGLYRLHLKVESQRFLPNTDVRYYLEDESGMPDRDLDTLRVLPYQPAGRPHA